MKAILIAVGSELLRFARPDSNGDWLTERLQRLGIEVVGRHRVGDDVERIADTARGALESEQVVLLTGGLGPTEDDRTRDALALVVGQPLQRDEELLSRLRDAFRSRGRSFDPDQFKQADRPMGTEWIPNEIGSAAGLLWCSGGRFLAALPGVPAEMKRMFDESLASRLQPGAGVALARRALKIGGRFESSVDVQLRDLYDRPGVEVTILTGEEGIELHLLAHAEDAGRARARLEELDRLFSARLGEDLYGRDDETLAEVVGRLLEQGGFTVATAESCTAGMLAASITDVPGSSSWFRGGLVVYGDDLKQSLADVSQASLARGGAVSAEVAGELAQGARRRCGADYGLGITGIAGPGGGTEDKPVGLVHVALSGPGIREHRRIRLVGDRQLVRRRAVVFALDRLRRALLAAGRERPDR